MGKFNFSVLTSLCVYIYIFCLFWKVNIEVHLFFYSTGFGKHALLQGLFYEFLSWGYSLFSLCTCYPKEMLSLDNDNQHISWILAWITILILTQKIMVCSSWYDVCIRKCQLTQYYSLNFLSSIFVDSSLNISYSCNF